MLPHVENILGQGNSLIQKLQKETSSRDLTHECSGALSQEQICVLLKHPPRSPLNPGYPVKTVSHLIRHGRDLKLLNS